MTQQVLAARDDRRTVVRYVSRSKTPCRLRRNTGEGPWLATIRNVSPGGIGLIAGRPFKPGMLLTVELPRKGQGETVSKLMKVTHAAPRGGSAWWVLGGLFASPLTRDEIASLL
jgi:hypothetical protein